MSRITLKELAKLNETIAESLVEEVDDNFVKVSEIKSKILLDYLEPLDKVIKQGNAMLVKPEILVEDLNKLILEIPLAQHYTFSKLAVLGGKEIIMRRIKKELYSDSYLSAEGNSKERDLIAEQDSVQEGLVLGIYELILDEVREKTKVMYELLNSAKIVLRQKISEGDFNKSDTGRPARY
jgi:hypothetical protein